MTLYREAPDMSSEGHHHDVRKVCRCGIEVLDMAVVLVSPCIHGNYDRHPFMVQDAHGVSMRTGTWCEGAGLGGDV